MHGSQNIKKLKLRKASIASVMFVCPHGATPTPLDGFS
jgi:hypothetical protein